MLLNAYQSWREKKKSSSSSETSLWPMVITHKEIPENLREGVIPLENLTESEILVLLVNSLGLLSPSLYEGFGRPPLEAALLGVPVVLSDIPPHQEIFNSVAHEFLFLAPDSLSDWRDALDLLSLQKIPPLKEGEIQKLAKKHDKKNLAQKLDQIYLAMLE